MERRINKIKIYINGDDKSQNIKKLLENKLNSFEIVDKNYDLAISIGGDGTFLKMVNESDFDNNIYFIGINSGKLGFLEEIEPFEIDYLIDKLNNNDFNIEEVSIGKIDIISKDSRDTFNFLNEVLIRKEDLKVLKSSVFIDNEHLEDFTGDGLLVSTSTGSTAYNLSFNGPIIYNKLNVLSLTPVAPINNSVYKNLTNSLIVNSDSIIKFLLNNFDLSIMIDGRLKRFNNIDEINITIDSKKIKCLRIGDYNFVKRINSKILS